MLRENSTCHGQGREGEPSRAARAGELRATRLWRQNLHFQMFIQRRQLRTCIKITEKLKAENYVAIKNLKRAIILKTVQNIVLSKTTKFFKSGRNFV